MGIFNKRPRNGLGANCKYCGMPAKKMNATTKIVRGRKVVEETYQCPDRHLTQEQFPVE